MMNVYAVETTLNGKETTLLTLLDPEAMAQVKNPKAILGMLKNNKGQITPDNILYNPEFVQFFHKTMLLFAEFTAVQSPNNQSGFMYLIDERCKTPETPEQKDIIGSFEVKGGFLLKDTYVANSQYEFISNEGLFQLPTQIEKVLFMALV